MFVDLAAYEDASIIDAFYLKRLQDVGLELPHGNLRRYRVPLKGGQVSYEVISDACMELPHFDYGRYNMSGDYRYVYAVGVNYTGGEYPRSISSYLVSEDFLAILSCPAEQREL